jgi:PPOX class probable F420-dependent enzyme
MTDSIGSAGDRILAAQSTRKIASLEGQRFVVLTTYRKNGVGVHTTVTPIIRNGRLFFLTTHDSGKVKRIRNNPRVTLASSRANGRLIGPPIEGMARLLSDAESAKVSAKIRRAWGISGFFIFLVQDLRRKTRLYYEIVDA